MISTTIFGSGNMGSAIDGLLSAAGGSVQHVGKSERATIEGDLVILAVPYEGLAEIARDYADQLGGRIVVDITNPLDFETFDRLEVPADSSAAAELQAALPDARVVKAFNTDFAATLESKQVGSETTTVLVAGDDANAKEQLIDTVQAIGLAAIDAGPLARARELEALGFLQLALANDEKITWSGGFSLATG